MLPSSPEHPQRLEVVFQLGPMRPCVVDRRAADGPRQPDRPVRVPAQPCSLANRPTQLNGACAPTVNSTSSPRSCNRQGFSAFRLGPRRRRPAANAAVGNQQIDPPPITVIGDPSSRPRERATRSSASGPGPGNRPVRQSARSYPWKAANLANRNLGRSGI